MEYCVSENFFLAKFSLTQRVFIRALQFASGVPEERHSERLPRSPAGVLGMLLGPKYGELRPMVFWAEMLITSKTETKYGAQSYDAQQLRSSARTS